MPVSRTSAELPLTATSSMFPPSDWRNGRTRFRTDSTCCFVIMSRSVSTWGCRTRPKRAPGMPVPESRNVAFVRASRGSRLSTLARARSHVQNAVRVLTSPAHSRMSHCRKDLGVRARCHKTRSVGRPTTECRGGTKVSSINWALRSRLRFREAHCAMLHVLGGKPVVVKERPPRDCRPRASLDRARCQQSPSVRTSLAVHLSTEPAKRSQSK
jgi:hypothetical protein